MILSIPYKALSRCNLEELAAQQAINQCRQRNTSGVAFAQKLGDTEKREARAAVLDLVTLEEHPGHISILTMPGIAWSFETKALALREGNWRMADMTQRTSLHCIENDRFVYYSATTKMPGNKHTLLRTLPRPDHAERAMANGLIDSYSFANVDDLMRSGAAFDVVWLDYTGPLSVARMKIIQKFWADCVRSTLVVTSLKARWNRETSDVITRNGGALNWMRKRLPGIERHAIEYQDGSPMVQFAVSKPSKVPA